MATPIAPLDIATTPVPPQQAEPVPVPIGPTEVVETLKQQADAREEKRTGARSSTPLDARAVTESIREEGDRIQINDQRISIRFNKDIDRVIIQVQTKDGETIRQFPPEDYVKFISKFREAIGLLMDEVA